MVREWVEELTAGPCSSVPLPLRCSRFVGLASSPPGFYVDEVVAGAQLACLTYTGVDAFGNSMPLVSVWPAPGVSAVFPPQYLYPGVAWVSIFGASVGSIRAIEVVISLTTVLATAGVAYNFFGRRGFAWALFLGAFSPWAWTLGRIGFGISGNPSAASLMVGLWVITWEVSSTSNTFGSDRLGRSMGDLRDVRVRASIALARRGCRCCDAVPTPTSFLPPGPRSSRCCVRHVQPCDIRDS